MPGRFIRRFRHEALFRWGLDMMLALLLLWGVLLALQILLAGQPLSADAQIALSATLFLVLLVLTRLPRHGFFRVLFIGTACFIVLRYVIWRTTSTLPPVEDVLSFIPAVLLYGAEIYAISMFFISVFVVVDPMRRAPSPVEAAEQEQLPTLDVLVPTYDEPPHILAATISAAKRMRYPKDKLKVYLLDDGGTDEKRLASPEAVQRAELLQQMCRSLGAIYLTRRANENAKAGNLNAALPHSEGELVAVFDADHAPTEDFLQETVGYFMRNPKLFLVQTPHFFINPDPLERSLNSFDRMPSENEMFYGVVQRGLDRWGASFFCGSAALLRRSALEQVGGFSGRTIVEDCETALDLHSRGWESIYIDRPMVAGLQPETFASFIQQRTRWCQGMIQIFLLKNPLFKRGLNLGQRIGYLSSILFWFFGIARLSFFLLPLCYLLFGLAIYVATPAEFLAYTAFYIAATLLTSSYLFGRTRWPLLSELYEFVQSVFTTRAILSVFLRPTAPTFKVTAKGETLQQDRWSEHARPLVIITLLLTAGLVASLWRWWALPEARHIVMIVGGWNLFAWLLAVQGLRIACERRQLRRVPRVQIEEPVALLVGDRKRLPAYVVDASTTGVKVVLPRGSASREELQHETLTLEPLKEEGGERASLQLTTRNIRFEADGLAIGAEFSNPRAEDYRMIADLIFVSSSRWVTFLEGRRAQSPGVVRGVLRFIWSSLLSAVFVVRFVLNLRSVEMSGNEPFLPLPKRPSGQGDRFAQHPMEAAK